MENLSFNWTASISYITTCKYCGDKVCQEFTSLMIGMLPPKPTLPFMWRVLDGDPVCPKHAITVTDKARK